MILILLKAPLIFGGVFLFRTINSATFFKKNFIYFFELVNIFFTIFLDFICL